MLIFRHCWCSGLYRWHRMKFTRRWNITLTSRWHHVDITLHWCAGSAGVQGSIDGTGWSSLGVEACCQPTVATTQRQAAAGGLPRSPAAGALVLHGGVERWVLTNWCFLKCFYATKSLHGAVTKFHTYTAQEESHIHIFHTLQYSRYGQVAVLWEILPCVQVWWWQRHCIWYLSCCDVYCCVYRFGEGDTDTASDTCLAVMCGVCTGLMKVTQTLHLIPVLLWCVLLSVQVWWRWHRHYIW